MKILFNGTVDNTNSISLKEYLVSKGYNFPCSGRGICGKCIVKAEALAPTDRDKRFLTETELALGYRLACDKSIFDGLTVDAKIDKMEHFSDADACAIIDKDKVVVYFVASGYVEYKVEEATSHTPIALRSATAHALLEMLEAHSVAKATTIYLLGDKGLVGSLAGLVDIEGKETLDGMTLMLPCDDVYVVPFGGGDNSLRYLQEKSRLNESDAIQKLVEDFRFRARL